MPIWHRASQAFHWRSRRARVFEFRDRVRRPSDTAEWYTFKIEYVKVANETEEFYFDIIEQGGLPSAVEAALRAIGSALTASGLDKPGGFPAYANIKAGSRSSQVYIASQIAVPPRAVQPSNSERPGENSNRAGMVVPRFLGTPLDCSTQSHSAGHTESEAGLLTVINQIAYGPSVVQTK